MTSTFYDELKRHALERPDHPAIMDAAGALSYSQFLDQVERFAGGLGTLPLTAHSKLGLMCLNQREFLIALLGAFLKGLPIVPYNYLLTPEDLAFITEDAGVDLILTHPMFVKPEAVPFFSQFKVRLVTGPEPGLAGFDARPWPAFLQQGQTGGGRHRREPGIPDVILYTSGTTAQPKGVMLNENQFFANTTGVGAHLEFLPEDRGIMALPLFHSFGNIIALVFLRAGSTLILIPQFQPKTILAAITEHRATVLPLVPTIYSFLVQLYERGGYDVSSLRYCVSGGAALPQALFHHVERTLGCTVLEGYGLTETSPVIAVNTMAQGSVPGSVGPVLPNLQVRIVNADGAAVAPGEVGEIVVQGETVMSGYWNLPAETGATFTPDGWLKTGDLGHLDPQGRLYISAGRKKDLIIRAGDNVSPLAIENALMNHPAVAEAAAIGVPDERTGEKVKVCVVLREGRRAAEKDLRDFCRKALPAFMVPDSFEFYDSLPKSPTGKVLKTRLREDAAG